MKKAPKNMILLIVSIISSALAIATAAIQYREKSVAEKKKILADKEAQEQRERADSLSLRLNDQLAIANDSLRSIVGLQAQIIEKNEQIEALTKQGHKLLFGDGSLPDILPDIMQDKEGNDVLLLFASNKTMYPMKTIYITTQLTSMAYTQTNDSSVDFVFLPPNAKEIAELNPRVSQKFFNFKLNKHAKEYEFEVIVAMITKAFRYKILVKRNEKLNFEIISLKKHDLLATISPKNHKH